MNSIQGKDKIKVNQSVAKDNKGMKKKQKNRKQKK